MPYSCVMIAKSTDGAVHVLHTLAATQQALDQCKLHDEGAHHRDPDHPARIRLAVATQAQRELAPVLKWLEEAQPSAVRMVPLHLSAVGSSDLAATLRQHLETVEGLGDALEQDDPITHYAAIQALGLASAVLGAAYQRLQRAHLALPRAPRLLA